MSDSPSKRSSSLPRCLSSDMLSGRGPGVEPPHCRRAWSFRAENEEPPSRKRITVPALQLAPRSEAESGSSADCADVSAFIPPSNQWDGRCSPVTSRSDLTDTWSVFFFTSTHLSDKNVNVSSAAPQPRQKENPGCAGWGHPAGSSGSRCIKSPL